jgi:hypothetical protein
MNKLIFLLAVILASAGVHAQEVYKIYDGPVPGSEGWTDTEMSVPAPWSGNPLVFNVTEPTITVYRPDKAIDTGASMIIAPGGAYIFLTWKEEGTNVAEWFQRHGVTGIVLKYRTVQSGTREKIEETFKAIMQPAPRPSNDSAKQNAAGVPQSVVPAAPVVEPTLYGDDGRQAIRYVRQHAAELGVNPDKIGLMGFSAGALVTSNVVFIHDEKCRPNLAAFIYGRGAANTIPDPMPLFMCSPVNDGNPPEGLFTTYQNWKAAGAPSELQFIYDARHGEGLQYNGKEWNEWIDNLYNFMKAVQFIDK